MAFTEPLLRARPELGPRDTEKKDIALTLRSLARGQTSKRAQLRYETKSCHKNVVFKSTVKAQKRKISSSRGVGMSFTEEGISERALKHGYEVGR